MASSLSRNALVLPRAGWLVLLVGAVLLGSVRTVCAAPRSYHLLVMRVDFSDAPGVYYSPADFRNHWVQRLVDYFTEVSNEELILKTTVLDDVIRLRERRRYWDGKNAGQQCAQDQCGEEPVTEYDTDGYCCFNAAREATDLALSSGLIASTTAGLAPIGGTTEDVFDGVLTVFGAPRDWPSTGYLTRYGSCGISWGAISGSMHVRGDVAGRVYGNGQAQETWGEQPGGTGCAMDPFNDKDLGPAVHEVGHLVGASAHPAGYINGYELMDSGYPCFTGAFTRMSAAMRGAGFRSWFDGWLPDGNVKVFGPAVGGTVVLSPIELDPDLVTSPQAVKVETGVAGLFYVVECRRLISWDNLIASGRPRPPGVLILQATAGADPETQLMGSDGWLSRWQPGDVFDDAVNDLEVRVGPDIGDGCTVTVAYGKGSTAGVPDVALTPWLTPPMNTWETVDIWIDSSCNGYEDASYPLKYGRRADAEHTVIGNGDDPCANRENRVYARVRNLGTAPADHVRVRFEVTHPLGVGIRGSTGWDLIQEVDESLFPDLSSIPVGGYADVYGEWTPVIPRTDGTETRFPFHSCVRVLVDTVSGERLTSNQDGDGEQENIGWFEAEEGRTASTFGQIHEAFFLANEVLDFRTVDGECFSPVGDFACDGDIDLQDYRTFLGCLDGPLDEVASECEYADIRSDTKVDLADVADLQNNFTGSGDANWFYLSSTSASPSGSRVTVGDGDPWLYLQPGEVRSIPITIEVPAGAPVGQSYFSEVAASVLTGPYAPSGDRHWGLHRVGGIMLAAQTVVPTQLTLAAEPFSQSILVRGQLLPPVQAAPVQVEFYRSIPNAHPDAMLLLVTDATGHFEGKLAPAEPAEWTTNAMWQGDLEHSWAESDNVSVVVSHWCGDGTCDLQQGESCETCFQDCAEIPAVCDDGNPCTDDACDASAGCTHTNNTVACTDGVFCNGADTCVGGGCSRHSGDPCAGPDGDSNCRESCDEELGECIARDPDGAACDDGIFCNGLDTCMSGVCQGHAGNPCPGADGDSNCKESCSESSHACTADDPNGANCDDGVFCNGHDACQTGNCSSHAGDPCSGQGECKDMCNEKSANCLSPAGTSCSDTDNNVCTSNVCNGNGFCVVDGLIPDGTPCPDDLFCNGQEECVAGVCRSLRLPCFGPSLQCLEGDPPQCCDIFGGCTSCGPTSCP